MVVGLLNREVGRMGAFRILTEVRTDGPIAANLQERMGDVNLRFCSVDFAIVEANP
jgi:hypothetical protein